MAGDLGSHDMDLPFEASPPGELHDELYPPIVLVADDDQMAKLRPLVMEAIALARRAAKSKGAAS